MRGKRTFRVVLKYVWYFCVLAILVGAYYLHSPDAFVRLPREKDQAVLGDWYQVNSRQSFRRYTFREDGTGEIASQGREPRKFWWGTDGERLQMKYQSYRGWTAPMYEYWLDTEKQISLKETDSAYTLKLVREPPSNSKVQ